MIPDEYASFETVVNLGVVNFSPVWGDKEATLYCPRALDLEEDSPELEAELLKAVNGPHSPLREGELREIADKVVRERRTRRKP